MPAQLLGDPLHLARRHALNVLLRKSRNQRLLRTLVALEHRSREMTVAVLENTQLQRPHTGHRGAVSVPGAIAHTMSRALALRRSENHRHLALQNTLQIVAKALPDDVIVLAG